MNEFLMIEEIFDDISILKCQGPMDEMCIDNCRNKIREMLEAGVSKFIFDMKLVEYVSSAGWAIFVSSLKKVRNAGGDIKLASLHLRPKHIFELLELDNFIDTFGTVDDAMTAFLKGNRRIQEY